MATEYADVSLPDFSDMFSCEDGPEHATKRQRTDALSSKVSEAERKQLERERNRMHARNTRARKKAYADELTSKLAALTKEKEDIKRSEAEALKARTEQQNQWVETLKQCMNLRAKFCLDSSEWSKILAEDFKLTMPVTPYRSFNSADVVNNRRVLLGIDGMIADTASLAVMCDNIGTKKIGKESGVSIEYLLGNDSSDNCFFGKNGFMCTFMMRTLDAKAKGALCECEKSGIIRVRFTMDGQIEELEMTFDGIAMYHQLMRAKGESNFAPVPNSMSSVLKNESDRIVVTTATRPFCITHVNNAWTKLCGFELEECKGKNLSILQGPETDMDTVMKLVKITEKGYPASMVVTNYSKTGRTFRNHLRCYPVTSDETGDITNIVGILDELVEQ